MTEKNTETKCNFGHYLSTQISNPNTPSRDFSRFFWTAWMWYFTSSQLGVQSHLIALLFWSFELTKLPIGTSSEKMLFISHMQLMSENLHIDVFWYLGKSENSVRTHTKKFATIKAGSSIARCTIVKWNAVAMLNKVFHTTITHALSVRVHSDAVQRGWQIQFSLFFIGGKWINRHFLTKIAVFWMCHCRLPRPEMHIFCLTQANLWSEIVRVMMWSFDCNWNSMNYRLPFYPIAAQLAQPKYSYRNWVVRSMDWQLLGNRRGRVMPLECHRMFDDMKCNRLVELLESNPNPDSQLKFRRGKIPTLKLKPLNLTVSLYRKRSFDFDFDYWNEIAKKSVK